MTLLLLIDTGLTRGTKNLATFTHSNIGYEALHGARIDGLAYPWMSVASGRELGDIAPGQVKEIALMQERAMQYSGRCRWAIETWT